MGEHIELTVAVNSFAPGDQRPVTPALDAEHPVNPRWNEFTDDQREAVLHLVAEAMSDLLERLDDWVPRSFVAESNNRIDLTMSVDLADIDNAVVLRALEADQEMAQAMRRIREMGLELGE